MRSNKCCQNFQAMIIIVFCNCTTHAVAAPSADSSLNCLKFFWRHLGLWCMPTDFLINRSDFRRHGRTRSMSMSVNSTCNVDKYLFSNSSEAQSGKRQCRPKPVTRNFPKSLPKSMPRRHRRKRGPYIWVMVWAASYNITSHHIIITSYHHSTYAGLHSWRHMGKWKPTFWLQFAQTLLWI